MIVVNLFGGPGVGKSTGAAYIFSKLKLRGLNVELVTEFAKEKTWENNKEALSNQEYIFGQQSYKISILKDKVDVVITDSPLLLSIIYNKSSSLDDSFTQTILNVFNSYKNMNYLIERAKPYQFAGRNQTEEESNKISTIVEQFLKNHDIPYSSKKGTIEGYDMIIADILTAYAESTKPKNNKINVITLYGKSGSGKNYFKNLLLSEENFSYYSEEDKLSKTIDLKDKFHNVIGCTTRPQRAGEKNGETYFFLNNDDFVNKIASGEMVEATVFNQWGYGTLLDSFDRNKLNIGIFNIEAIECLMQDNRFNVYPVLVEAADRVLLERALNRENNPKCEEICRRFLADKKDFARAEIEPVITVKTDHNIDYTTAFLAWAVLNNLI